jgi:hypothetical protein
MGPFPMWWEETLEAHERAALRVLPKTTNTNKTDAA